MRYILSILSLAMCLTGCATVTSLGNTFEGAADYRVIPDRDGRYAATDTLHTPLRRSAPVNLSDYSLFQAHPATGANNSPTFFTAGDFIQISLRTGMIGWFSEGVEQRFANQLLGSQLKGEIAIIANVTEGATDPGGIDAEGNLQGRVVFYSGDVYLQQRLNEFNVPIHGPERYGGGPLTVDMWVLELDRAESDQMGAVLSTLTNLSSQVPSLSVPGLSILNQIGTAFLNSNTDDVIGRIRITFAQPRPGARVTDPILQVSDVVISRTSRIRGSASMLDSCTYDPRSGLVAEAGSSPTRPCGGQGPHNRNNIFVLAIRKVPDGPNIASTVTLTQLNERLARLQVGTTRTPDLTAAIEEMADVALSASTYSDSIAALDRIIAGSAGAPLQVDADLILKNMQCALLVARHPDSAALAAMCGGARAADRQMSMENLARLSQRLVAELCFANDDLSFESLLGSDPAAADLVLKRAALYAKFTPRPSTATPGTACPAVGSTTVPPTPTEPVE